MPLRMMFEQCSIDVLRGAGHDGSEVRTLRVVDSRSGIEVLVPLDVDAAETVSGMLKGVETPAPKILRPRMGPITVTP